MMGSIKREYPSKLLERAVEELGRLPGVGDKTALRMALSLLEKDVREVDQFTDAVHRLCHNVKYCAVCHNISDTEVCSICSDRRRDETTVCVVQNVQDVMAIEHTQQYNGLYHVLGGTISPADGRGPADVEIASLVERVQKGGIREIILALSTTMEGNTTNFYIARQLANFEVNISVIAQGIAVGEELEYIDDTTLGQAVLNRTPYKRE